MDVSHLIAFLVGTGIGAAGEYFAIKFTDQRRRQEAKRESHDRFEQVRAAIPKLLVEMHDDYMKPENAVIRELFLLPNRHVYMGTGGGGPRTTLAYYQDDHTNLHDQFRILENNGYVHDVTSGKVPKYQVTEEFVELVRNMKP